MHFDLGHIHANEIIVGSILGLDCTESYSVPENLIESILSLNPLKESVMSSFIIY
ncbi:trifolitoxin-processing tfxB domain protein [Acinetobacter sp. 1475718]|nr:trifolitoxin-processing tfxB domain protein [Acinetobacter sp. 1475718]